MCTLGVDLMCFERETVVKKSCFCRRIRMQDNELALLLLLILLLLTVNNGLRRKSITAGHERDSPLVDLNDLDNGDNVPFVLTHKGLYK